MEKNNAFASFFRRFGEKINFEKNKWYILVYGCVILATVIVFSSLMGWAAGGKAAAEITVIKATALARENARKEYLIGETPETDGFALVINGEVVSDCSVEIDTSTAGVKAARVFKEDGDIVYEGSFPVNVIGVRHLDIRSYPTEVKTDTDGNILLDGMVVWAELSEDPKELPVQTEHEDWTNVIVLDKDQYKVTVDVNGNAYTVTLFCGNASLSFGMSINFGI